MRLRAGAGLLLVCLATAVAPAGGQEENARPFSDVRIGSMELSDFDSEGLQVTVQVSAISNVDATLATLAFERASVNTVRVNLPPVQGPIRLRKGQPIEGLPPLRARVRFREIESLQPIRRILDDERARFEGTLRARLSLNIFQKLVLMTTGAWVVSRINDEVPVEIVGGMFTRLAAGAALTLAEPIWSAGRIERSSAGATVNRASEEFRRSGVLLETRYDVTSRGGETARMSHSAAGFLVDGSTVMAPAEALEPWLFDEALAEAIGGGTVTVRPESVDVTITSLTAGADAAGKSLQNKQVRVVKVLKRNETAISVATKRRFTLRMRASNANAALLGIAGGQGTGLASSRGSKNSDWRPATIARVRRQDGRVDADFLQTSIRWNGMRYEIRDPVDAEAFGSPIWTDDGVVGMVQDDTSGAATTELLDSLR